MKNRRDFETPRTTAQMKSLVDDIAEDRESIPDSEYHRRRGIAKDLIEEYAPLQGLAEHTAPDCRAYLLPPSNQGPDGVIELASGESLTVQITVADQNDQVAMGRERLSEGDVTFPTSEKFRNPKTRAVEERGRVLTTRKARLEEQVTAIVARIQSKNDNFYQGTDILLVGTNIFLDDRDLGYRWEEYLRRRIAEISSYYPSICVYTGKRIIEVYP